MINKYADLILLLDFSSQVFTTTLIIYLLLKINHLLETNKDIISSSTKLNKETTKYRIRIPKILTVVEANADDIGRLKQQMNQVHEWLGSVLNISNFIPDKNNQIDSSPVIEELRERVKWSEELEKQKKDETDFYNGD